MENAIEEKLNTILAFSREKASESDYTPIEGLKFYACPTEGLASILLFGRAFFLDKSAVGNPAVADKINIIYLMLLGLDKRDALEAERGKSAKLVKALTKIRKMRKTDRYWDGESMTKIAALALEAYKEGKKDEN